MKTPSSSRRTFPFSIVLMTAIMITGGVCQGQATNRVLAITNTANVSIPSSPKLQNPTEMTIEAWFYPVTGTLISKSDGQNVFSGRTYEMSAGGNRVRVDFFLGSMGWAGAEVNGSFNNKWTHVAATFSSAEGTIRLYVNGSLTAQATNDWGGVTPLAGLTVRQSTEPVVLGYDAVVTGPLTGLMDEVRIWSTARSTAEIQANMYQHLSGTEANLAGYWNFDAGTAADATTNHFNGTFNASATTAAENIGLPVQIAVSSVAISFPTGTPQTTYQVQYSTNMSATNWINLGTPLPGNGTVQSITDPVVGEVKKFYRVIFF